jgi:hypothetical protein
VVAVLLIGAEMEQEFEQTQVAEDGDIAVQPSLLSRLGRRGGYHICKTLDGVRN